MKTENQRPKTPDIGEYVRGQGRLVAVEPRQRPEPPPAELDFIFEEITSRIELRHNGETIKEFGEVWDAYGLETSVAESIKCAKEYAEKRSIGPKSEMEVVAIRIASRVRKRIQGERNSYDKTFCAFEHLNHGSLRGMPDPEKTVAWTSKAPDAPPCNND